MKADWTRRARKDLSKLDPQTRRRIADSVDRFTNTGFGDIRKLSGFTEKIYRLRIGDWRVIFSWEDQLVILVLRVRSRDEAYRP